MSHDIQIQQRKSNQQSFVITGIAMLAILITLLFIKLSRPIIDDAISGVMIDFGDSSDGLGDDNLVEAGGQSASPAPSVSNPTPPPPAPSTPINQASTPVKAPQNTTITAVDPQAVAIAQAAKEEKIRQQKALLEQQRIAELVKKAEQERLAREAEEARIKAQTASVFTKGKTVLRRRLGLMKNRCSWPPKLKTMHLLPTLIQVWVNWILQTICLTMRLPNTTAH